MHNLDIETEAAQAHPGTLLDGRALDGLRELEALNSSPQGGELRARAGVFAWRAGK